MDDDSRAYLMMRADAERTLARNSTHPLATQAHEQLASLYLDRLKQTDSRPAARAPDAD